MDVAVGDKRFDRYYRKIRLGLRLMSHGARAQTSSDWSGLTLDQLVTLRKRWMPGAEDGFRGPSPTSYKPFFRSALKASHAAMFVGIHRMVGIDASKPSLEGGERLCEAFEIYREWEPDAHLEFDYAVLLATGVIKGEEVELSTCARCGCALLLDKLKVPQLRCARCRSKPDSASPRRRRVSSH
jgi:Flagellar transcriptional activator (FlhC)